MGQSYRKKGKECFNVSGSFLQRTTQKKIKWCNQKWAKIKESHKRFC